METITSADGTAIAYERIGQGPPLVLVHGTAGGRGRWSRLVPLLAAHYTTYSVDRRGRGGSGDAASYDLGREVEDVLALRAAIGEPVHLFGHSYGAIVSLELAQRTGHLRSLILYEPPFATGANRVPPDFGDRLAAILATGDHDAVLATFFREGPRRSPEEIAQMRTLPDWPERLALAPTLPREAQAVAGYTYEADRFAELHAPILLLCGSESPPPLQQTTSTLHATLPHSELSILEGQGHNAMDTAPDLLFTILRRFLNRQEVRSPD